MSFPTFLSPLVPLTALSQSPGATAAPPLGGAAVMSAQSLPFVMQTQQEDNWCWAATTSSVSKFYDSTSAWSQCNVASTCLGAACCSNSKSCDQTYSLDAPLQVTGNLRGAPTAGSSTQTDTEREIDQGHPVCCHITWIGGRGHFVAISGYDPSTGDLYVEDPFYGRDVVPYATFVSSYRGSGSWDYTYLTES